MRGTCARRPLPLLIAAVGAAALLTACTTSPEPDPAPTGSADSADQAEVEVVAQDLAAPWSLAFHDETPLLSERDTARIVELDGEGEPRDVGTVAEAAPRGEGGLLGIATRDDYLYAYYTAERQNVIARYPLEGEPGALSLGAGETILDGIPAAGVHNGGRIAFGPDGLLYATTGDAGDTGNAQDLNSLGGKILRMKPDGRVPEDNPFGESLVYSYGHRNPQGIAWDENGTMWSTEFGQNTWDELNRIEPGGNYGWPEVEGIGDGEEFIDPVQQWEPAEASPSGMAIANGSIYFANLRGERLIEVPLDDLTASTGHLVGEHGRLRDVVTRSDGTLWVLTNNTDGRGEPRPGDDRVLEVDPAG